ncbi:MAG: hypothetical protein WC544_03120 [Patescibacteria group bacterium]
MALPPKYLPKIKMSTAKDMAKNLVANRAGQKISETKFKQILKKDESLKTYYYKPKDASLNKIQAKKFFNQVVSTAKNTPGLKISRLAQKIGIKPKTDATPSNIALNKLYQKATDDQLKANAPTGPSPEEVRKQQRHDDAMKIMHKRDRADEMKNEYKQQNAAPQKQSSPRTAPPTMQGSITGATLKPTGTPADDTTRPATAPVKEPDHLALAVLPLINLSPAADRTAWLTERLTKQIRQALRNEGIFNLAAEPIVADAVRRYPVSVPADHGILRLIGKEVRASMLVYGHLKKIGALYEISVYLTNVQNDQHLALAVLRQETDDVFDLERRLTWQVHNALNTDSAPEKKGPPTDTAAAVDLPM